MRKCITTIKRLWQTMVWLTVMIRVRYHYNKLYLTNKRVFLDNLRPIVGLESIRMAYPDAFIFIKHADVERALLAVEHHTRLVKRK